MSGFTVIEGDVAIRDGANATTIKSASTAAVAADTALVVAVSPNNTVLVSGPLTDTQIRATALPVVGPLTDTQLRASAVPVSGPLTDTQIRASALPVTGPLTDTQLRATAVPVSGPLTDTQLRATTVPVTAAQGTAAATAGAWPTKVTDGTNVATVKPASTAPVLADSALVVVLSPNQAAIPTTTSPSGSMPNTAFGTIDLAAITTAAIRRTAYTEQSANFTGSIASASAADAAAGTGARTVRIYYVDATGATAGTEDATLNGTSFVNLVTTTKCFIEKIEVLTVGSGLVNAGIITLKSGAAGAGTTIGTIAAVDNQTFWAHHYVVTGKTCNVTGILAASTVTNNAGICAGFLRAQKIGVANAVEKQVSDFITVAGLDSAVFRSYGSQIQVPGPARITMYMSTLTGSAFNYRGSFDSYDV